MKNSYNLAALVAAALSATAVTSNGHNLDTRATGLSFAQDWLQTMTTRAAARQPLVQVNDEFWLVMKTTPGPGTTTGVGGYQTFYVPQGTQVVDVAYVQPSSGDPRGFVSVPMKGQSPIAIGDGSIGAKAAVGLNPGGVPVRLGPNINGVTEAAVTSTGLARGTIAGVYADTGIFFSTDPRTAFNSYGAAAAGGGAPMINNAGDTVGEWDAANVAGSDVLGVMTLWDSDQLRAFGRKDGVGAIIDPVDERGNAPWGMACAVAGPQSGYAWSFNYSKYLENGGTASAIPAAIEVGPWQRVKYPGSQVSKDQAGLASTVIGYVGVDASSLGINATAIPATATAVRFAIGQLELGRSEYSAVKVKVLDLPSFAGSRIYADAFGGDAGGTSNGKDHIWRYFDPTVVTLQPATLLQKVASESHIAPGGTTSFAITFVNLGPAALSNVALTDVLPAGLSYLSAVPAPGSVAGSTVTWNVGTVQPNQIVSLTIYVKATATGTLLNTVTATSNGQVLGNAYDTVDVGVFSLLRETKTVTPSAVSAGQNVTYSITISNDGTGPNGVPLVVTDFLPAGFTFANFVSATVNGASVTPTITSTNPNAPVFSLGQAIQGGRTAVINFVATVGSGVPAGTYYNGVDLSFEGKKIGPHPEAPVTVGGGQIGDTVYTDTDGSGTQDAGEPGIAGVTVTLYNDVNNSGIWNTGDTVVGTKVTDSNGSYIFTGLPAGNYVVKINSPPAGTNTGNPPGGAANPVNEGAATLPLNGSLLNVDFGYQSLGTTGSIGDQVFYDVNADGNYNAGDSPLPNVSVKLYASDGTTLLATTTTDAEGRYTFAGRPAGTYTVKVDLAESDIPADLVCSVSGGAYNAFTLAAGQSLTDKDFPFTLVFIDKTVDKAAASAGDALTFDIRPYYPGPTLLTNATVTDGIPVGTSYRDASANAGGVQANGMLTWNLGSTANAVNGETAVPNGTPVTITQRGTTTSASVTGSKSLTIRKPSGVVAGDVMIANFALADGVAFPASNGWSTVCNASYEGKNRLHRGAVLYRVADATDAAATSYVFALDTVNCNAVGAIVAFSGVDVASGFKPDGTIGGPFDVANNIPTVSLTSGDVSGVTSITTVSPNALVMLDVMAWDDAGTVSAFSTATSPGTLNTGSYSFHPTQTIGSGWGTKATPGPTGIGSALLSSNKKWGAILLALKPAGSAFKYTTALSANRSLVTSGDTLTVTLTATATGNAGTVTAGPLSVTGTNGASAVCSAASPLTAPVNNGSATFTYTCTATAGTLLPGVLTFKATPSGSLGGTWAQGTANTVLVTPPLTFVATVNANPGVNVVTNSARLNNDGTLLQTSPTTTTTLYGAIGDYVWWDADRNGVQDATELPIPNAYVMLYADVNNNGILDPANGDYQVAGTMTNASGHYLFGNLPAGNYLLDVYEDSFSVGGVREAVPTTPNVLAKTLAGGEQYLGADFGYFDGARVDGNVFWDANRDAVFEAGEVGLHPVTVSLTGFDLSNSPVAATAVTDAGGHFFFIVPEGNYTLTYSNPNVLAINPSLKDATTPVTYSFHAYPGEDWHPVFDFGVDAGGKIGDTIFADANSNHAQGAGEAGLANVTVELYLDSNNNNVADTGETLVDTQATDANGKYLFVGLADGNYVVKVLAATLPTGYQTTSTAVPPTESTMGASQAGATVSGGGSVLDRDFGYPPTVSTYSVSGNVWNDNGAGGGFFANGRKDGTEPGLANVKVAFSVDADGTGPNPPVLYTILTDASGNYTLTGVPGTAAVIITVDTNTLPNRAFRQTGDPDGTKDNATTFTMAKTNVTGKNFGYYQVPGSIAGAVVLGINGNGLADAGEAGLAGAVVTLRYAGADGILNTADDGAAASQMTTGSGTYSFSGLMPGLYQVTKVNPPTYVSWADADGGNPDNITVVLDFGPDHIGGTSDDRMVRVHQDFEDCLPATIAGSVKADTDNNGSGDTALAGVTVTLKDGAGNDIDSDSLAAGLQPTTAQTGANGGYSFAGLLPGSYQVVETDPSGYTSVTPNEVAVVVTAGGTGTANFVDVNPDIPSDPGFITGTVWLDSDGYPYSTDFDGMPLPNTPLGGVTLALLDAGGHAVIDNEGHPVTTTTATGPEEAVGTYSFTVPPGNYMVAEIQPQEYRGSLSDKDTTYEEAQAGGNPDLIGDKTLIAVTSGASNAGNDFIDFEQAGPDISHFSIVPGIEALDGTFLRPAGGAKAVIYSLEYKGSLTDPGAWNSIPIIVDPYGTGVVLDPDGNLLVANAYVYNNGDGTETVRIVDIENLTGLTSQNYTSEGFVRIRLDHNGPQGIDATSHTEVLGWTETKLEPGTTTFNKPYLASRIFSGTVDAVNGQTITFTNLGDGVNLADLLPPVVDTYPVSYYLEVASGENEGQRFDVESASESSVTLANDSDLYASTPPYNTLVGALPASLSGASVVIRPHWTLDSVFPPGGLGASDSQATANEVQVYDDGAWKVYWLYYDGATGWPRWVDADDPGMADQGGTVIPPGKGMYFFNNPANANNQPDPVPAVIVSYGEVRLNAFVCPLAAGQCLVGGGYPVAQSAMGAGSRGMTIAAGFTGSYDFSTADSIVVWNADFPGGTEDFSQYYLFSPAPADPSQSHWLMVGDATATPYDSAKLMLGNRAVIICVATALPAYRYPSPWAP